MDAQFDMFAARAKPRPVSTDTEDALLYDLRTATLAPGYAALGLTRVSLLRGSHLLADGDLQACAAHLLSEARCAMAFWEVYQRHGIVREVHPTATLLLFAERAEKLRRALGLGATLPSRPVLPRPNERSPSPLHASTRADDVSSRVLQTYRRRIQSRWFRQRTPGSISVDIERMPANQLAKNDPREFRVLAACFPPDSAQTQHVATIRAATIEEAIAAAEKWIRFANDLFDLAIEDSARRAGEVS